MSLKRKLLIILIGLILVGIVLIKYSKYESTSIDYEQINVKSDKFNSNTKGIRILQISDIHLPCSQEYIDQMIDGVADVKPDIILMTGDLINRDADIESCGLADLCKRFSEIAPCYAVSGNHDLANDYKRWINILTENGINVMDNKAKVFSKNGNKIAIMGLSFNKTYKSDIFKSVVTDNSIETILLAHNPADFDSFFTKNNKVIPDLVFCGHAHGGQVRIPIINQGLFAPEQGIFPAYTSGGYTSDTGGIMIVSRGLGSGRDFLLRINDRVHIPVVNIENKD